MMKNKKKYNEVARKVALNVLEWLTEEYPDRKYESHFKISALPDGPQWFSSVIYQRGPSSFRKVFPKKIAVISQFMGSNSRAGLKSYDTNVLPSEKLEELMKELDVQAIYRKELLDNKS